MRWLRLGPLRCEAPLSSPTREGETDESLARSRFRGQSSIHGRVAPWSNFARLLGKTVSTTRIETSARDVQGTVIRVPGRARKMTRGHLSNRSLASGLTDRGQGCALGSHNAIVVSEVDRSVYASSLLITSPLTSVRRKSRPWNLKVNWVWSRPSRWRIVA